MILLHKIATRRHPLIFKSHCLLQKSLPVAGWNLSSSFSSSLKEATPAFRSRKKSRLSESTHRTTTDSGFFTMVAVHVVNPHRFTSLLANDVANTVFSRAHLFGITENDEIPHRTDAAIDELTGVNCRVTDAIVVDKGLPGLQG